MFNAIVHSLTAVLQDPTPTVCTRVDSTNAASLMSTYAMLPNLDVHCKALARRACRCMPFKTITFVCVLEHKEHKGQYCNLMQACQSGERYLVSCV